MKKTSLISFVVILTFFSIPIHGMQGVQITAPELPDNAIKQIGDYSEQCEKNVILTTKIESLFSHARTSNFREMDCLINTEKDSLHKSVLDAVRHSLIRHHQEIENTVAHNYFATMVNHIDEKGRTLLHFAAKKGEYEAIELLCKSNANVNSLDRKGHTPLHFAAKKGDIEAVKLLCKFGANIDQKDTKGFTPLSLAVRCNHTEIVQILIAHISTCPDFLSIMDSLLSDK